MEEKPILTFKKENIETSCSDAISFLRQVNPKFMTVSYEVTQTERIGITNSFTSHGEKPRIAADKIDLFMRGLSADNRVNKDIRASER